MFKNLFPDYWPPDAAGHVPHFAEQMAMALSVGDKSIFLQCDAADDVESLVRGVARFVPSPARCFVFHSDDVMSADAPTIVAPLLAGGSVVLAGADNHELLGMLHNQWLECAEAADGTTFVYGNFVFEAVSTPGFLAVVHIGDTGGYLPYYPPICRVPPQEIAALQDLGRLVKLAVEAVGIAPT